jgi:hypothetical protein
MLHSEHLFLAHKYWKELLLPTDKAIDATLGNGHDTLFLVQTLPNGKVFSFDVQNKALENAKKILKQNFASLENVFFFLKSHEDFTFLKDETINLVVYNLGYLPGGDKSLTTKVSSTLKSVEEALSLITSGGAISITCYRGHEEGALEEKALLQMVKNLPSSKYSVCYHEWVNKTNAPSLIWIRKN